MLGDAKNRLKAIVIGNEVKKNPSSLQRLDSQIFGKMMQTNTSDTHSFGSNLPSIRNIRESDEHISVIKFLPSSIQPLRHETNPVPSGAYFNSKQEIKRQKRGGDKEQSQKAMRGPNRVFAQPNRLFRRA